MVLIDLSSEEISYIKGLILKSDIKKNIVLPDPTVRGISNEKIVDINSVPTYQNPTAVQSIAPVETIGSPLAETDKRKELMNKIAEKAKACGYEFTKEMI